MFASRLGTALVVSLLAGSAAARSAPGDPQQEAYGRLPMHFETNGGQADPAVKALARGAGYTVFLTDDEAVLSLVGRERSQAVRMRWLGARPGATVVAQERLPGRSHYYRGNVSAAWSEDVAQYQRVRYAGVYPGVDLVFYGSQRQLEYDFVLAPGADPRSIRLRFEGTRGVRATPAGELLLDLGGEQLVQRAPLAYQEIDGVRRTVAARYELHGREVRFAVSGHDPAHALVIDPVLSYSTYLGGVGDDNSPSIAVAPDGSVYLAGCTGSTNFPTLNPHQASLADPGDLFVARLTPAGNALVFSTYLGGTWPESCRTGVAVDAVGSVYLAGSSDSPDFPTLNPFQTDRPGTDAIVAKLSASGALQYSTYLGGGSGDVAFGIALAAGSEAVVVGQTLSADFPLLSPYQNVRRGTSDAFVTRLSTSGSALVGSTYLGGTGTETGWRVAVTPTGSLAVGGDTSSTDFPLLNAIQTDQGGLDMFVAELNGATLLFSTYLGGGSSDGVTGLAVDGGNGLYVAGGTFSSDFPTLNPVQPFQGGKDLTLTKLAAGTRARVYATYIGGSSGESGAALAIFRDGTACVGGRTSSANFPSVAPLYAYNASGWGDAVVACVSPDGQRFRFATFIGGGLSDEVTGLAAGVDGAIYLAGETESSDFPTLNPFQTNQPAFDVFVSKIQGYVKGDQNRDGRTDLLLHNNVTGENQAWLMNGTAQVSATTLTPSAAPSLSWQVAGIDDFNEDGHSDLLFWDSATGTSEFWLMNGTTRVGSPVALAATPALPWRPAASADLDRDGRPDLLWRNYASCTVPSPDPDCQKIRVWLMNGTAKVGELVPKPAAAVDNNWELVGALDLDADTHADLLWYNGTSGKIVYWLMRYSLSAAECSGQGLTPPCLYRTLGQFTNPANAGDNNWKVLASGDYGLGPAGLPGTKDLVWRNATSGRIVVWHMDNAGNRTFGLFTTPVEPTPNPTDWTIAGPR